VNDENGRLLGNRWVRWGAVVLWMAVIFFLSAQPQLPHVVPSLLDSFQDIIGHFVAYGVLGALLYWALDGARAARPALLALVVVFLYALSDEFHQSFVPNRHPDPFDVATDIVGAAAALFVLNSLRSLQTRRRRG
jgi:VanZ family protein